MVAAVLISLIMLTSTVSAADVQESPYRLGAEDKLRIKVYDWRKAVGDAHEWTALTGDFTVGAAGTVFLPLVGEIMANHRTPSDVAHDISSQLQKRFGLAEQPDASVEIAEYRPFYIIGIVDKAGTYAYRPGLTVLQAWPAGCPACGRPAFSVMREMPCRAAGSFTCYRRSA